MVFTETSQQRPFLKWKFENIPPKGHLQPESETEIELTFKSTRSNQYVFAMTVDLPGIGKGDKNPAKYFLIKSNFLEIISIPVNCRCQVPEIVLETPILELGDIFLDYPIQTKMILRNASTSLRAVYHFSAESDLPQGWWNFFRNMIHFNDIRQ